jgi:DNA topoisomerase I
MTGVMPFSLVRGLGKDPVQSARVAGLRYTTDARPGIRRQRNGKGFRYLTADGTCVRAPADLGRIRSLVIPPAWRDVWICPDPRGHLQVTGRDARGRKQYRYHPRWRQVRDETKYHHLIDFAHALPKIRRTTSAHLRRPGLPREKVLATVVRLLEKTLIRIGNDEYAKTNRSYGLTTLRNGHVAVNGQRLRFCFRGKSGVEHEIDVTDRRLARTVKQCRELPGYDLFQYVDEDGGRQSIGSEDVNAYLKDVSGQELTSKDFRTWAGTVLAADILCGLEQATSARQAKKQIVHAVATVAERLGNTKAVCRKCYIHPAVFEAHLEGSLIETLARRGRKTRATDGLSDSECAVLDFLERQFGGRLKRKAS